MFLLLDGKLFNSALITVVKPVLDEDGEDGEEQSIIFTSGADTLTGGFLVDEPFSYIQEELTRLSFTSILTDEEREEIEEIAEMEGEEGDEKDGEGDSVWEHQKWGS